MRPTTHARSRRLLLPVLLFLSGFAPAAHAVGGIGDLFVTSDAMNATVAYNGITGNQLGTYVTSVLGSGENAIHFGYGPSYGKVAIGHFGGGVDEFDATTGAYIKTYSPGGGWQWAGIYAPNGNIYIGSQTTNDIREYDGNTGAFVRVLCAALEPADMQYGPNGNLYICLYSSSKVLEVDPITGATISFWPIPPGARTNDIAFLPGGEILVTAFGLNYCFRFDSAHNFLGLFQDPLWGRPHGITISPYTGNILIADGVTCTVSEWDPVTFTELNPSFCSPSATLKIVDVEFRPDQPTPVGSTSWGRIKSQYRR